LTLKHRYGKKTPEGDSLQITLTREELADLIGTTQETVIRLLSEFKEQGVIQTKGKQIVLTNSAALLDIAELVE
jgi:CRP-like cAMP-binding protein